MLLKGGNTVVLRRRRKCKRPSKKLNVNTGKLLAPVQTHGHHCKVHLLMNAWPIPEPSIAQAPIPDPGAWGGDHVGKSVPEFMTGDECLFCHRKVGATWQRNRHYLTVHPATDRPQAICLLMGIGW